MARKASDSPKFEVQVNLIFIIHGTDKMDALAKVTNSVAAISLRGCVGREVKYSQVKEVLAPTPEAEGQPDPAI